MKKHPTPEQTIECAKRANERRSIFIANDDAREYVATHYKLRKLIVRAQTLMYKARYELELSVALGEDVDNEPCPHFDKSFDYPVQASKVRDEAMTLLQDADDIERNGDAYVYLFNYLFDLTMI